MSGAGGVCAHNWRSQCAKPGRGRSPFEQLVRRTAPEGRTWDIEQPDSLVADENRIVVSVPDDIESVKSELFG